MTHSQQHARVPTFPTYGSRYDPRHHALRLGAASCGALLLALALLWLTTPVVHAVSCAVPSGSYATIQSAVNNSNCDTVNIAAGTYTETVTITRTLTVIGAGPSATILDGDNSERPLTVYGSGVEVRVSDLGVRNGDASDSAPQVVSFGRSGGGVMVYDQAKLWLNNVYVYNNVAKSGPTVSGFGGGIGVWNQAQLHATDIRVYGNVANNNGGSGFGGGIAVLYATAYITNSEVMTNAAKLTNPNAFARGGGLYVAQDVLLGVSPQQAYLSIVDSTIAANYATNANQPGYGGGLYVGEANTLRVYSQGNTWRDNVARQVTSGDNDGQGGAVAADITAPNLDVRLYVYGDTFYRNVANPANDLTNASRADAGALFLDANDLGFLRAVISNTTFYSNMAQSSPNGNDRGDGGAIRARHSDLTVYNSDFYSNTARTPGVSRGGAIRLESTVFTMTRSILHDNTASLGGGIFSTNGASTPGRLYLTNNWIVNHGGGGGIYQIHQNPALLDVYRHLTIVGNDSSAEGIGIQVSDGQVAITNTIVASSSIGIENTGGAVTADYILFYGNGTDQITVSLGSNFGVQDPEFVNPAARDYHIKQTSPARDTGQDLSVPNDIDGQLRDDGSPDIGADEYSTGDVPVGGLTVAGPSTRSIGASATFTASVNEGTNISYTWSFGNGAMSSGNPVSYTYNTTGTYIVSVIATNSEGSQSTTKSIQIVDEPITGLGIQGPSTRPVGSQASFTATVSSGTGIAYTWDFGNGANGSGNPVNYTYNTTGTYTVTVTAANSAGSAVASKSVVITGSSSGSDTPISGLTAQNSSPTLVNNTTHFTAAVSSGTNISYTWNYGDGTSGSGTSGSGINATHVYTDSGVYTATVTAVNDASTRVATTTVYIGDVVVEVGPNFTNSYSPEDVIIGPGDTVVWVLRSGNHSVTADDGSFEQPLGTNWSPYVRTFNSPGTYRYYCELHGGPGGSGMSGTVTVTGPGPSPTPKVFLPLVDD